MSQQELRLNYNSPEERQAAFESALSILEAPVDIPSEFSHRHPWRDMDIRVMLQDSRKIASYPFMGNAASAGNPEFNPGKKSERRDRLIALADSTHQYDMHGPIADVRLWSLTGDITDSPRQYIPDDPADRVGWFREAALAINRRPFLFGSQVMEFLTAGLGSYYRSGQGIGRVSPEGKLTSAFSTPSEGIPEYPQAYALTCLRAFHKLSEYREFSQDDPFYIFVFGDGEGRIINNIKKLVDLGHFGDFVKIVISDFSGDLLARQSMLIDNDRRYESIRGDARLMGNILRSYGRPLRGAIIAGEELVDAFAPIVIGNYKGNISEYIYDLSSEDHIQLMGPPVEISPYAPFIEQVFRVFPHYQRLLRSGDMPPDEGLPVNIGFVQMLRGIAENNFQGYFLMGDYYGGAFGKFKSEQIKRHLLQLNPPIRAYYPGSPDPLRLIDSFTLLCDVTGDVDPAILQTGYALGMRKELLAKPFQFIDAALGKRSFIPKDLSRWVEQLQQAILRGIQPEQKELIMALMGRASTLAEGRFNFIGAFGVREAVPPLFDHPPQEW